MTRTLRIVEIVGADRRAGRRHVQQDALRKSSSAEHDVALVAAGRPCCPSNPDRPQLPKSSLERPDASHDRYDVLVAADMTRAGDFAFRIAEEVRTHARNGRRVGLVQAKLPIPGERIAAEILHCTRRGLAEVAEPAAGIKTDLLVLHAPSEFSWSKRPLAKVEAARAVMVCHSAEDYGVTMVRQRLRGSKETIWTPTNPWSRRAAPDGLILSADDWAAPSLATPSLLRRIGKPRIAWLSTDGIEPPSGDDLDIFGVDLGHTSFPALADVSLDRLASCEGLVCYPTANAADFPETVIRAALASGAVVVLPRWLEPHFGAGPIYAEPRRALAAIRSALRKAPSAGAATTAIASDRKHSGGHAIRPIVLLASNGVGVGHVSRLLAIARRLDVRAPVLFVTQAQAVGAIERLGFRAEYIPSAKSVGGDFGAWDQWFRFELECLIDAYDPALVVYDGNNPSDGLVAAVASRPDCRLAWVRRGLWGNLTSPFLGNSRWFDLIIEPGELEGQTDTGITALRREEAMLVPPITLLDEMELLSREKAAQAIGFDPSRPAVLIQLGAGYNRDIISLIDDIVAPLREVPDLQIGIAEWVNAAEPLNYWPNVKYLRGFPLSQYLRAFDFAISAAGYNSFHESIAFGMPTIFIPNRGPTMDDQAGRAMHAQNVHAAFELDEADLEDLPDLVTLLLDGKARDFLVETGRNLRRPNGAQEAAYALSALAGAMQ